MQDHADDIPDGLRVVMDPDPSPDLRATLGRHINEFHARTVPFQSERFAFRLLDSAGELAGGVSGVMAWGWLFIDAVWIGDAWRGRGLGRALMVRSEAHAAARGCHAVWLDTFQARGFYEALGYAVFGELEDYPPGQKRFFLRKRLVGVA